MSDLRTLAVVHARWPDLCPEFPFLAWLNRGVLDLPEYRLKSRLEPFWSESPDPLAEEWDAVAGTARWHILEQWMAELVPIPTRILDVGAWLGAWSVRLSNFFADATVDAVEIVASVAPRFRALVDRYARTPAHVRLHAAHLLDVVGTADAPRDADVAWVGEIFEHQWDWRAFLAAVEAMCKPGALICGSTPYGPWEPDDPTAVRGHVAHWEAADLLWLLTQRAPFNVLRLGDDTKGLHMWRCTAQPGAPLAPFPIDEKLTRWGFEVVGVGCA
jgi:SAM-dependent methyltransferase